MMKSRFLIAIITDHKTGGGTSSFFPNSWGKEKILEEIALAFKNKIYQDTNPLNGNIIYKGVCSHGWDISITFNPTTNKIISAYTNI
jgi:hypothetical protein